MNIIYYNKTKMVNYENSKIYKIVDNTNDNIYIGSTTKLLCQRLAGHRTNYELYKNKGLKYITSFKILENGDYDIVLLLNYPCNSKEELHAKERYYIETLSCVNKNIPGRSIKERMKLYYADNKEEISEKRRIII